MNSGYFSPTASEDAKELNIPFYCVAYEQDLLQQFGIGECASRSASPVMSNYGVPSSFADPEPFPSTFNDMEDPCYFLGVEDVDRYLPPIHIDMPSPPAAQVSADVKPGVKEMPVQEAVSTKRYEPYPVPSAPQQPEKRKRGRPMKPKPAGESKMATYSRQYREMKKNQLNQAVGVTAELKQKNEELRSQLEEGRNYIRQLEQEVEHLRQMMYDRSYSTADVPVAAHY